MKNLLSAILVAAALVLGHGTATAQAVRFKPVVSVYLDETGAGLNLPESVACDAGGGVIVGDTGNDRLLRFTLHDKTISLGGVIKVPELLAPMRLQLGSKGDIYALDGKQRRLVHLGRGGEFKEVVRFDAVPPPTTVVVKDFALDSADNIYVLDVFSARVLVLTPEGKFQRSVAFPDSVRFGAELALDAAGNVLLLDSIGRRLYSASKDGASFAPLGGDLSRSLVTLPSSMTTSKGMIFVAEGTGGGIAALGRDGSFLGRQLAAGWEEGALNHPSQICINDRGDVFVADRDNSRVQVFQLIR